MNWNTQQILQDVIRAIREFSPAETNILVCDNGSTDESPDYIRNLADIERLMLPTNAGHGVGLDLSMARVRTDIAVVLDSDAIPIRTGWLDPVVGPVRDGSAVIAGTRSSRDFVHPVLLALDVETFLRRRLSFQVHMLPGVVGPTAIWGVNAWDTGELLSLALERSEIVFIDGQRIGTEKLPGGMVGDLLYHHGGMTRLAEGHLSDPAIRSWRVACDSLGIDFLDN